MPELPVAPSRIVARLAAGNIVDATPAEILTLLNVEAGSKANFLQSGTGAVSRSIASKIGETVSVKDFGAVGDGVTDDTAAWAAFILEIQATGKTGFVPNGDYRVDELTINYQRDTYKPFKIVGESQDTIIRPRADHSIFHIDCLQTYAVRATGAANSYFSIENLQLDASNITSTKEAIKIGTVGFYGDSFLWSQILNVLITGFKVGVKVWNFRHLNFTDVVIRNQTIASSIGFHLYLNEAAFVGDINFTRCETGPDQTLGIGVLLENTGNGAENLRGIHFTDCVFYDGINSVKLLGGGGQLGDVYFENCVFDGPSGGDKGIFASIAGGICFAVSVNNCDFMSWDVYGVHMTTAAGAQTLTNITVSDSFFSGIGLQAVSINKAEGLIVSDINTENCNTTNGANIPAVEFNDCHTFIASNIIHLDTTGTPVPDWVAKIDANCDEFEATNIRGDCVNATVPLLDSSSHDIASAATLVIPNYGSFFNVTGTTNVTQSIAASWVGRIIHLTFAGTLTVIDGGLNKLAGTYNATADSTLVLLCDGTNWYELSRSTN